MSEPVRFTIVMNDGTVVPITEDLAGFFPTAYGGDNTAVPDLDAITVGITRAAGAAPLATGFQLRSDDSNYHAFVKFGTAVWTFSNHAGEDYAFQSLTDKLAGETAGTAVGPYVGHVYVTGPGTGVATPLAHQWSVTLHYPGLPSRTITWEDGALDIEANAPCGAVLVSDPDVFYGNRTRYWTNSFSTVDLFYDDIAAAEAIEVGSSGVLDFAAKVAAEGGAAGFKSKYLAVGAVTPFISLINTVRGVADNTGEPPWRVMVRAGDVILCPTNADRVILQNMRLDRFGPSGDPNPTLDATTITSTAGYTRLVQFEPDGQLMNFKVLGPFDPVNPGAPPRYELVVEGLGVPFANDTGSVTWRCEIAGFHSNFKCTYSAPRTIVADCHIHSWYNYGMLPQAISQGGIWGCRVAQPEGTKVHPRFYFDNGGGNSNHIYDRDQSVERLKFDWSKQIGRAPLVLNGTPAPLERPTAGGPTEIPAGFEPPTSGGWGTHPYDTVNGGTAAWDWWVKHWMWFQVTGWHPDNRAALTYGFVGDYFECVAIHGPIRIPGIALGGMAIHQVETVSRNGWSAFRMDRTLVHPVIGRWDVMQDPAVKPKAWALQPGLRLFSAGTLEVTPEVTGSHGTSIWRCTAEPTTTSGLQIPAATLDADDSMMPESNVIMDGLIIDGDLAGTNLSPRGAVIRNSLMIDRDAPDGESRITFIRSDANFELDWLIERVKPSVNSVTGVQTPPWVPGEVPRQAPTYAYNNTMIQAGDQPNALSVVYVDGVTDPYDGVLASDRKGRRIIEWNNVRIKAALGPDPDADIEALTVLDSGTDTTPTQGLEAFDYAPDGTTTGVTAVKPTPLLDLEGATRAVTPVIGAFKRQA